MNTGADAIHGASEGFRNASQSLASAAEPIRASHERIETTLRSVGDLVETVSETLMQNSASVAENASHVLETAQTALGNEREGIRRSLGATRAAMAQLSDEAEKIDHLDEMLGRALTQYNAQLEAALGTSRPRWPDARCSSSGTRHAQERCGAGRYLSAEPGTGPRMRAQAKQVRHEEEEERAFVSMVDMTVGLLFVMMILLAFIASQMRDPESVSKREYDAAITQRDAFEQQSVEWRTIAETRANRILELEALLVRLRQERDDLEAEVKALLVQRAQLEADLTAAEQDVKRLQDGTGELEKQLAELQKVDPLEA